LYKFSVYVYISLQVQQHIVKPSHCMSAKNEWIYAIHVSWIYFYFPCFYFILFMFTFNWDWMLVKMTHVAVYFLFHYLYIFVADVFLVGYGHWRLSLFSCLRLADILQGSFQESIKIMNMKLCVLRWSPCWCISYCMLLFIMIYCWWCF